MTSIRILTLPLGPVQTNCYIVAEPESGAAVVIDPGGEAQKVLAALSEQHWELRHLLLTHAHFDHIGGAADLVTATKASLAIHPLELPLLRAGGGAALFGLHVPPCPEPDVQLQPNQAIEAGRLRFQVLLVPGHTPGHVAFYAAQAKAVFSGDVLFKNSIGRTDLPGGDYATLMRSIREVLFALPDDTAVYPGHGPATTIGDERNFNPFLVE